MIQDKIVVPVRLAETENTCGKCQKFNLKTKKCSQKTRCGGVIITDANLKACVNFAPKQKILDTTDFERLYAALKIVAEKVECAQCPLMSLCSQNAAENCIRTEAAELVKAIQENA